MPPDLALLAQAALEFGLQHAVEDHPGQRIAWLSRHQVRTCGLGPDSKELFGRYLVSDVPLGDTTHGSRCQHVIRDMHVFLEFDAAPVLGELRAAALNGERRVLILAIGSEEGGEHGFIPLLPRCLVALHELIDIHNAPLGLFGA